MSRLNLEASLLNNSGDMDSLFQNDTKSAEQLSYKRPTKQKKSIPLITMPITLFILSNQQYKKIPGEFVSTIIQIEEDFKLLILNNKKQAISFTDINSESFNFSIQNNQYISCPLLKIQNQPILLLYKSFVMAQTFSAQLALIKLKKNSTSLESIGKIDMKKIEVEGEGEGVEKGNSIEYIAWIVDNYNIKLVDNNVGKEPLSIENIVKGLSIGINDLKIEEQRIIFIPPKLAYGTKGVGDKIPPNSFMLFYITMKLLKVNTEIKKENFDSTSETESSTQQQVEEVEDSTLSRIKKIGVGILPMSTTTTTTTKIIKPKRNIPEPKIEQKPETIAKFKPKQVLINSQESQIEESQVKTISKTNNEELFNIKTLIEKNFQSLNIKLDTLGLISSSGVMKGPILMQSIKNLVDKEIKLKKKIKKLKKEIKEFQKQNSTNSTNSSNLVELKKKNKEELILLEKEFKLKETKLNSKIENFKLLHLKELKNKEIELKNQLENKLKLKEIEIKNQLEEEFKKEELPVKEDEVNDSELLKNINLLENQLIKQKEMNEQLIKKYSTLKERFINEMREKQDEIFEAEKSAARDVISISYKKIVSKYQDSNPNLLGELQIILRESLIQTFEND